MQSLHAASVMAQGRSVASQRDIEDDPEALTRWLDEEERLNDERRARLERWREDLRTAFRKSAA